ncbi:MAG: hypothetical protein A2469_01080 [Candidatus Magasanikbacteria bacterium RIFOXYC2_FULL_40_16]|uniref:Uncharacterized protein n=3 Tax=Candidatus Magasanikiibacteriota TaxID=1752731 RepID=A0A1F6NHW6_9BACT|nr:MAG: hypothetical protein A2373_02080 [Candidatus Magasanikbacteria bacterium RIFOXYB1_FULL_40_15]OGH86897.1 MAG: hypothetical protein A2301_02790 [Candidatus Magasanikbacteria bacterium RIFOXYB2_FULL_40_13]OGH87036.1 MAG: hypothetical protein A2206_00410 [Candidatus Magasanikbacteria bacterium RIFOXYA1_FULL_40_8]OGH90299.1 MAG: hypothetical protein A2469_01080 [Candidatus Magasanikbacteria bacterium RIFOXYC2_FULL_40_16]
MDQYQNNNQEQNQNTYSAELNYPEKKSKLKMILIIVGVALLLGGVIYLLFFTDIVLKKSGNANEANKGQDIGKQKPVYPSLRVEDDDLDNDGLLDAREEELGTSNSEFDTDMDGIPDNLEVDTYKTDPIKFDTDGDGYSDGYEIMNGYNPLGEGRL